MDDRDLKWDIQMEQMCNKLGKMVSYMSRLRQFLNMSELKLIYKSIVLRHFDYGDAVWQSANNNCLFQLQNKAGRIIT